MNLLDRLASFDTETFLIQPGLLAPPLVCGSLAARDHEPELLNRPDTRAVYRHLLESDRIIVGANIAYDNLVMAVDAAERGVDLLPLIFAKYRRGEFYDIQIAEALYALAGGHLGTMANGSPLRNSKGKVVQRYSQDVVVKLTTGYTGAKANDRWRLFYHRLYGRPIESWPKDAIQYPKDDVEWALKAAEAQLERAQLGEVTNVQNLPAQARAAWALHLAAAWGLPVDGDALGVLEERVRALWEADLPKWVELGIFRVTDPEAPLSAENVTQDEARTMELVAFHYGAKDPCPKCKGSCWECYDTGRVPGKWEGTTKNCPNCNGGRKRPPCEYCAKTGLDIESAPVPRTDTGRVAKGRDDLYESGDETLMEFGTWLKSKKVLKTYIPNMKASVGLPWTQRPNVLLQSGRSSYSGIIMLLPRDGGVRECVRARPGTVFSQTDYGQLELYTWAQCCIWTPEIGYSKLGEALNAGEDVHIALAAQMIGISYEEGLARYLAGDEFFIRARQAAKPGNYMFPGGGGVMTFVKVNRSDQYTTTTVDGRVYNGIRFCVLVEGARECGAKKITKWNNREYSPVCKACAGVAHEIKESWKTRWTESELYFRFVSKQVEEKGYIVQHVSNRVRGNAQFCDAANGYFQGLASEGAKDALFEVSRECYADPSSPLYGSRVVLYMHDEIICEHPLDVAHEAATRVSEIMETCMGEYVPDVRKTLKAEPALTYRYSKGAKTVRDSEGKLVPWDDR